MNAHTAHTLEISNEKLATCLAYLLPPIIGIVLMLMGNTTKATKFHTMQSIVFGICWLVLGSIAHSLNFILIGFILSPIINIGFSLVAIFAIYKIYTNENVEIPVITDLTKWVFEMLPTR